MLSTNESKKPVVNYNLEKVQIPIWLTVLLFIYTSGVFIVAPYWNGLYFYNHFERAALFVLPVTLIPIIWLFTTKVFPKKENFLKSFYPFVFILGCVYIIDSIFHPAQSEFSIEGVIRFLTLLGILIALSVLFQTLNNRILFLGVLLISGTWISLFGLANAYGTLHYDAAISYNRTASVFQYPNTNASFASAVLFISFFYPLVIRHSIIKVLTAVGSYILLLNLTLSYSRGAWITFALLSIIMILVIPKTKRLDIVLSNLPSLIAFILTLNLQIKADQSVLQSTGWGSLSVGIVLTVLLSIVANRFQSNIKTLKMTYSFKWFFGVVIFLLCIITGYKLFIHSGNNVILDRIKQINFHNQSVAQRLVYYKDGLSMFIQHPILGDGFGTWQATFDKFESYPYYSKHEHSYLIELLVETGIVGFIAFLLALLYYVRSVTKLLNIRFENRNEQDDNEVEQQRMITWISLFVIASILFHAAIDFDMSFGIMNFLLWGMMAVGVKNFDLYQRSHMLRILPLSGWTQVAYSLGVVSLVVPIYIAWTSVTAESKFQQAQTSLDPFVTLQKLRDIRSIVGYNSLYWIKSAQYADTGFMQSRTPEFAQQSLDFIKDAINVAPYDDQALLIASQISYKYGQFNDAFNYLNRAMVDAPYYEQYPEQFMVYKIFHAEQNLKNNKKASVNDCKEVINTLNQFKLRVAQVEKLPSYLPPEREYKVTDQMNLRAAEAFAILDDGHSSKMLLDSLIDSKDPNISLTAKMVTNVLIDKKKISGTKFDITQNLNSSPNVQSEFSILIQM